METGHQDHFSAGDGDVLGEDVNYTIFTDKLFAERNTAVAQVRWLMVFCGVLLALVCMLGYANFKSTQAWTHWRFPFVWANAQGTPVLVTNAQSDQAYNDISDVVVKSQVRQLLDARFGVDQYHARQVWPSFMTYWLNPMQAKVFRDEAAKNLDALQADGMWRRVQVRFISLDKRTPLEGGGTRYDATVEFLTSDLKFEDAVPKRTNWWRTRLAFSLGTPLGLKDPSAIQAVGAENALNFRVLEYYPPVPIEVPMDEQLGTIQAGTDLLNGSRTGLQPQAPTPQAPALPVAPAAQPLPSTQPTR
jgi:hypothetical protein